MKMCAGLSEGHTYLHIKSDCFLLYLCGLVTAHTHTHTHTCEGRPALNDGSSHFILLIEKSNINAEIKV